MTSQASIAGDPCEARRAACEFVRGFVQHTLPPRLQKIRYYGWMGPNSAASLDELRWLVSLFLGCCYILTASAADRETTSCDRCAGELQCVLATNHEGRVLHANALPYLDSG
ncbi:MAG: transposase [Planctomycetales bacterium]|nr:transposase [Planctomycetales bacterium]